MNYFSLLLPRNYSTNRIRDRFVDWFIKATPHGPMLYFSGMKTLLLLFLVAGCSPVHADPLADTFIQHRFSPASTPGHRWFVRTSPMTNVWVEITRVRGFEPGQRVHAIGLVERGTVSRYDVPLPPGTNAPSSAVEFAQVVVLTGERQGWFDASFTTNQLTAAALQRDHASRLMLHPVLGRWVNVTVEIPPRETLAAKEEQP
jgi:hypothetical protein